jgi:hypothetical protein
MFPISTQGTYRKHANRTKTQADSKGTSRALSGAGNNSIITMPTTGTAMPQYGIVARTIRSLAVLVLLAMLASGGNLFAQITSGTIFGTVKDQAGLVLSGAKVTLQDKEIGFDRTIQSGSQGTFVAADIPNGTYTITASAKGFKAMVKEGVVLDVGARLSVGDFKLAVGADTESITVLASGGEMQLQAESGERSSLIDGKQIDSLLMNGGNILDYMKVIPGINSTFNGSESNKGSLDAMNFNGTRGNEHGITVDGISNEDNGCNCAVQVTVNSDAIGEAKVETSNFQAEYGKAAGGSIALVIKNGTRDFHGGASYVYRNESLNANSWFNDQTNAENKGTTNPVLGVDKMRLNDGGLRVGGPVLLPKWNYNHGRDRLFFFVSEEYYHQVDNGGTSTVYVPTLDEINGDFSKSTDGYGNPITIKDPVTGKALAGNIIPSGSINKQMQQILLKAYPRKNTSDSGGTNWNRYNYQFQNSFKHPRREDIGRVDWQVNPANRFFFRYINNSDSQGCPTGCDGNVGTSSIEFPGGMHMSQPGYNVAFDLTSTLRSTLVNEITTGWSVNKLDITSVGNSVSEATLGVDLPLLYSEPSDSPIPNLNFSGIANGTSLPGDYLGGLPYHNALTTINFTDNLIWSHGRHTFKVGVFVERARKDQSAINDVNGSFNFSGTNTTQTLQTGNPFANALYGDFTSFDQASNRPRGFYRYSNVDGYIQDTWKVTSRLTLDYGIRFPWYQPQYDAKNQTAVFNPSAYDPTKAVRIYRGEYNGFDFDPANPSVQVPDLGVLAETIVPNSGSFTNGVELAKNGYYKGAFKDNGVLYEPRFGFAYDVFGNHKTIVRGGAGISHDRFQGNPVYGEVTNNAPNVETPTINYGTISGLQSAGGSGILSPYQVIGFDPSGKLPTVYSYSLGVQHDLGKGVMVDVAYVGNTQRHLNQERNLDYDPYGSEFALSRQDPWKNGWNGGTVPASCDDGWMSAGSIAYFKAGGYTCNSVNALPQMYSNRYMGYTAVQYYTWDGEANFNSLQVTMNRRFGHGLTFGGAYTWSKTMDMTDGDGSWVSTISEKKYNYGLAGFDRANNLAVNYVYDLPKVSRHLGGSRILSTILDNYQVSGVSLFITGAPADLGGVNWNYHSLFDGSASEPTNFTYAKGGGKPVLSRHGRYAAYNSNAFAMPPLGVPAPWPTHYFRSGGSNDTDLSVQKRILVGSENHYFELRGDAFNAFNHPQFYGRNSGASVDTKGDTTGGEVDNEWDWLGSWESNPTVNMGNLTPIAAVNIRAAGDKSHLGTKFGDYNSSGNSRILQLSAKFYF